MNCFRCGTLVGDGTRFCANCGQDVSAEALKAVEVAPATDTLLEQVRARLDEHYDVERELGRGGMAVVYRAVERELQRPVALKVMPPQFALTPESSERFKREARMTASLDHPHVIPIYRVGEKDGLLYIAMKLVDGRALDDIMRAQGALPVPAIVAVMRGAAAGLAAAHERGIVHRDIKGGNILVDRDGRVMVTDFGIARAMADASITQSGMIVGTPHYMSPEQCAGRPLGPQSDQYSLAALAFQMLTGDVPFDSDSLPGVMQHHFFTPIPDFTAMRPGIPPELAAVVRRALAKKPEDRYASTQEMVDAIDAIPLTTDDRRAGEDMLRRLARGEPLPRVATSAAPTVRRLPQGEPRLTALFRAARARLGARLWMAGVGVGALVLFLAIGGGLLARNYYGPQGTTRRAVKLYEQGRREAAQASFAKLANDYPQLPVPRVYLGRIARETRQYDVARRELEAAIQLDPSSAIAMREMGSLMFVTGRFEVAERFYRRALARDPDDHLSRGYLGCSLVRLGRTVEGYARMTEAGRGPWSSCR